MNIEEYLVPRKRVDILIESVKVERIAYMLEEIGVEGYTIVGNISGKGKNGVKDHNCKAKIFENTLIFTVCTPEQAEQIILEMSEVLKYFSGTCFITDTNRIKTKNEM